MSMILFFLFFFFFSTISLTSLLTPATAITIHNQSAYEALQGYGFPKGILPKGVKGYDLDPKTGKFSAYLSDNSCSFALEDSYQLKYQSTIKGSISHGRLNDLQGVSVKVLFFWFNIVEVVRSGDDLEFSVGIASANFPVDNFEECPQCGCGLDCNHLLQVRKIGKTQTPFVDSF